MDNVLANIVSFEKVPLNASWLFDIFPMTVSFMIAASRLLSLSAQSSINGFERRMAKASFVEKNSSKLVLSSFSSTYPRINKPYIGPSSEDILILLFICSRSSGSIGAINKEKTKTNIINKMKRPSSALHPPESFLFKNPSGRDRSAAAERSQIA
ncbi:MAG TPA: hypothetical protein PKL29_05015 [Methanothrix sp.]|nr:hypothetical protein [Methanothrix sp.]